METRKPQMQRRLRKIVKPNDKLSKVVGTIPAEEFNNDISQFGRYLCDVTEDRKRKIATTFTIEPDKGITIENPLTAFDRAVLDVCVSELAAGYDVVTVDRIYRGLVGGVAHDGTNMTPRLKTAINASIKKMMSTLIEIDASEVAKHLHYPAMPEKLRAAILPCVYMAWKVNGRDLELLNFFKESPLVVYARAKGQLLTYETHYLDVPNFRHTPHVIGLKFYLVGRVMEFIKHNLTPTITFADVFAKCGIDDKYQKRQARQVIETVLNHLQAEKVIDNFSFERDGHEYRAIKFCYSQLL